MQHKKLHLLLVTAGIVILTVTGIALASVQPAKAQCGSQASSCKNCHEVQAQKPVNNDGTAWHTSHAFGDFCYICHGGNQQATDKTLSHTGMVAPLADIQAACAQCHPNDLQARAQVYAVKLGVQIGAGGGTAVPVSAGTTSAAGPNAAAPTAGSTSATRQISAAPAAQATLSPSDPNLVNFVQRYNEDVLGQHPINWGNIILLIILVLFIIGAGYLINRREGWIVISLKETKPLVKDLPEDVADMAPEIAKLKPAARKSLRRLLSKPRAAAELFSALDGLSSKDSNEINEKEPTDPQND